MSFWFGWTGVGGFTLPLAVGKGTGTPPMIPCTTVLNVGELASTIIMVTSTCIIISVKSPVDDCLQTGQ